MSDSDENELAAGVQSVISEQFGSTHLHAFVNSGALRVPALQDMARDLGCFSLNLPEAHGGLELGLSDLAPIYAVLGAFMPPLAVISTMLAVDLLERAGAQAWLARIADGASTAIVLPPWSKGLEVVHQGDRLTCRGEIPFMIDAADADLLIFRARVQDGHGWIVCRSDLEGVNVERLALIDETRSAARIRFEDVQITPDCIVASGADVAALGDRLNLHAALAIAADSLGGAGAILSKTLDYMRVREQFSRPIGSFQALKHRAANLHLRLVVARSLLEEAVAAAQAAQLDAQDLALLACAHATEAYAWIAEDTLQLHGGIGFTREHDAHLYLKRAKLNQAMLGGPDRQRDAAACSQATALVS